MQWTQAGIRVVINILISSFLHASTSVLAVSKILCITKVTAIIAHFAAAIVLTVS